MFDYIEGKVVGLKSDAVVIDINGMGFLINTPRPGDFVDEKAKAYIYNLVKEDEISLYGFSTEAERELFLKLISVKGVGPKTAIGMLTFGSVSGIIDAIERENLLYLKSFPKIGSKAASQIILDLKGKLNNFTGVEQSDALELVDVLKQLGYKEKEIKRVIPKIDITLDIDKQIKEALKHLSK